MKRNAAREIFKTIKSFQYFNVAFSQLMRARIYAMQLIKLAAYICMHARGARPGYIIDTRYTYLRGFPLC